VSSGTPDSLARAAFDAALDGMLITDDAGCCVAANHAACALLGVSERDLVGRPMADAAPPPSYSVTDIAPGRHLLVFRAPPGTGVRSPVQADPASPAPLRPSRIGVRSPVQEEGARVAAIVESSQDAILSYTLDGTIVTWNPAAERMVGYSASEIIGQSVFVIVRPERTSAVAQILKRLARGEPLVDELATMRRKDGSLVDVSYSASPLRDAAGKVIGASAICRDFTQRRKVEAALRRAEEQLQQARKMDAIGNLAAGVAHDFNNLLFVILGYVSLAHEGLQPAHPARRDLEQVRHAAEAAAELTKQLLAFSRRQVLEPRVLRLESIVRGVEKMMSRLVGETVELSVQNAVASGRVFADPGQLKQVLTNLIVNARDAMPNGGRIEIETANVDVATGDRAAANGVAPGGYVRLTVTDTGTGMDASLRAHAFEPFFTTKEAGKGTGLGLSTVYGIVSQSGGYVLVDTEVGRGTTFDVYLPRTDGKESDAPPEPLASVGARGSETILVVEDDALVRESLCSVLRRHGYNVLDAQNAGEALLACEQEPRAIDLLLTDVVMPRVGGPVLARRLSVLRPDMKVIFMSGYPRDLLDSRAAFLQKPVTPEHLLRTIRETLEAPVRASTG
jgi:PAS domain S-box-containing protein